VADGFATPDIPKLRIGEILTSGKSPRRTFRRSESAAAKCSMVQLRRGEIFSAACLRLGKCLGKNPTPMRSRVGKSRLCIPVPEPTLFGDLLEATLDILFLVTRVKDTIDLANIKSK